MATDIKIAAGIITVFVLIGVLLPYINDEFNNQGNVINTQGFEQEIGQGDVSTLDIVKSVFLMFFWTFGTLPFWLDAIFLIIRVVLALAIWSVIAP